MSTLTLPNTFSAFTKIQSALVNANFTAIASIINGAIDNTNIATGAAIAYSKLNLTGTIVNADIATGAAIAYAKLALTNSIVDADIATGAAISFSKLQTGAGLPIAQGGTGQVTKAAGFDALSPTTTKGDIPVRSSSTNARLGVGSDGQVMVCDSTQALGVKWTTLQQGAKNYITYGSFENNATTGWSLAHSALTSLLPTSVATAGTAFDSTHGGSAAAGTLSFAAVSSGAIGGSFSGSLAASAATVAGDMLISQAYTIDLEDQAKMLAFRAFYKAAVGAANSNFSGSSSNTWAVYVYDVTNGAWIQPAGVYNLTQSSGVGVTQGTFQTPSNMTQFQLALVCVNASAGAVTLLIDDVTVGPQVSMQAPAMDDWVNYTPTFTGFGTVTNINVQSKREGDTLKLRGSFQTGTTTAVTMQMTLGYRGASGGVTSASSVSTNQVSGHADFSAGAGTSNSDYTVIAQPNSGIVNFGIQNTGTGGATPNTGNAYPSSTLVYFTAEIPIQGWSSNSVASSDTDTRVCAVQLSGSTTSLSGSLTVITPTTVVKDTHGSWSGSTYTVPVSGWYQVQGTLQKGAGGASTGSEIAYTVNGGTYQTLGGVRSTNSFDYVSGAATTYLSAGSAVQFVAVNAGTAAAPTSFYASIFRLSGPAVVTATESVNARYHACTTTLTTAYTAMTFNTKDYDSHNAYSGSTFTAPVSGKYSIKAMLSVNFSAVNNEAFLAIYKNGAEWSENALFTAYTGGAINLPLLHCDDVQMLAGDTIQIFAKCGGSPSVAAGNFSNYFAIARVGN